VSDESPREIARRKPDVELLPRRRPFSERGRAHGTMRVVSSSRGFVLRALACALACGASRGDVKLAGIFGDNMVLQRDVPVNVWGSAPAGERVRATLDGKPLSETIAEDGRFAVQLPPQKAGGPHELRVHGVNEVRIANVWFGEVWLCAGQSNMGMPLADASDGQREVGRIPKLDLHMFNVAEKPAPEPASDVEGHWIACRADDAERISAVAYFFASDLHAALNVPIGLVQATGGGTPAEAWTDEQAMKSDPALKPSMQRAARAAKSRPGALFNGMIAPLTPLTLKGVIWYQGESNTAYAEQYRILFPLLVRTWRKAWAREDLPFLFVQLPGCGKPDAEPGKSDWAETREAQTLALALPHTGMAVAIDVGDVDLHPPRKREVGERLARVARARVYGDAKVFDQGPTLAKATFESGAAVVRFEHADGGLKAARGEKVSGFSIAGADGRFVWADARIEGDHVIVKSLAVQKPVAVRYGWADNPTCNLYNGEGLPAVPFRTDAAR
jgi:sialate O-acetylesterase